MPFGGEATDFRHADTSYSNSRMDRRLSLSVFVSRTRSRRLGQHPQMSRAQAQTRRVNPFRLLVSSSQSRKVVRILTLTATRTHPRLSLAATLN